MLYDDDDDDDNDDDYYYYYLCPGTKFPGTLKLQNKVAKNYNG